MVQQIIELRDRIMRPPLWRHVTHPFVPHVTLRNSRNEDLQAASLAALGSFEILVTLRSISLLRLGSDGRWTALGDCPLGLPTVRGRGTLLRELRFVERCAPDVARLFGGATRGLQVLEARNEDGLLLGALGFSVETILGSHQGSTEKRSRGRLEILAVTPSERGFGIGGALVQEVLRHLETIGSAYVLALVDFSQVEQASRAALLVLFWRFGFSDQEDFSNQGLELEGKISLHIRKLT